MNDDKVNTTERVQVEVRPFMVPILELAEQRMAERERAGFTMDGMRVFDMGNRMEHNAVAFNTEYWVQNPSISTDDERLQHLVDVLNLAGLTAHLFIIEQAEKDKG